MSSPSRTVLAVSAVAILAGGLVLGWVGAHLFGSTRNVPTVAVYNDWRLACPGAAAKVRTCALEQNVVDGKSGQRVATLAVGNTAAGTQVLVVTGPYNVLIGAGLGLGFGDAKPTVYPYLTCNGAGCVAQIPFDDALRSQFRSGGQGKLVFANINKQPVQVNFSLNGFARADTMAQQFQSAFWWLGVSA